MIRLRILSVSVVLMIVATSCGMSRRSDQAKTAPKGGSYGDPNSLLAASPSAGASQAATGSNTKPGATKTSGAKTGTTTGSGGTAIGPRVIDRGSFGAHNGRLILGGTDYTEINIEIDYVQGRKPSQAAIDHLVNLMKQVAPTKKVTVSGGNMIGAQGGSYTGEAIEAIGDKLRDEKSVKPKASIWVGYLDGQMEGAAGVAVSGTICAVFMDTVSGLPFPPSTKLAIEKTILVQEVFHLLGLVNIGYTSPRPHEDKEHPKHSKNPKSVMYWALMTQSNIIEFITNGGSPPTNFDADDLADLKDLANGVL